MLINWRNILTVSAGFFSSVIFLSYLKLKRDRRDVNKYLFIDFNSIKCQECFNRRKSNVCGNTTCSFALVRSIAKEFSSAQKSIFMCNPIVLIEDIVYELIKAHQRGVLVKLIVDANLSDAPEIIHFLKAGIPVRSLGNDNAMMHNKFLVIDDRLLIRGSLNYTSSLKGNCENIQFIRDDYRVSCYTQHFLNLWDENSVLHKNGPGDVKNA